MRNWGRSTGSQAATAALRAWGASTIPHPGGTLLDHLVRTENVLRSWDAPDAVALAGLCHAVYGTDGFDTALLSLEDRSLMVDLVGREAEELIYLYASCDRNLLNPQLGRASVIQFRDRFNHTTTTMPAASLSAFMELTFANEIDILRHNPEFAAQNGTAIATLFRPCRALASRAAFAALEREELQFR